MLIVSLDFCKIQSLHKCGVIILAVSGGRAFKLHKLLILEHVIFKLEIVIAVPIHCPVQAIDCIDDSLLKQKMRD